MITLFRRFRQKLLNDNRLGKYLLYAMGEILLVVIGILIALQVNNWNQQRILKEKEKVYLQEIRASLERDLMDQDRVLKFNEAKMGLIQKIIPEMGREKSKTQHVIYLFNTLGSESDGHLVFYEVFSQNRAAFDNMVSAENISIIRDKELRSMLSEYYRDDIVNTGTQERVKEVVRKFADLIVPYGTSREMMKAFMGLDTHYPSAEEMDNINNPEIVGQITLMYKNVESHSGWLSDIQENTQELIEKIDAYLAQG